MSPRCSPRQKIKVGMEVLHLILLTSLLSLLKRCSNTLRYTSTTVVAGNLEGGEKKSRVSGLAEQQLIETYGGWTFETATFVLKRIRSRRLRLELYLGTPSRPWAPHPSWVVRLA